MGIRRFIMNGCGGFSLFQDFHVQDSDGLFRDLVGEFDSGMAVPHKVDEIQKLVVAQLGYANAAIDVSFVDLPRSGELRTQKLKSHLVRTQSSHGLPLKPGVGQYIAIHATPTARDFILAYFYPSSPFNCIFPKPLPSFSCVICA